MSDPSGSDRRSSPGSRREETDSSPERTDSSPERTDDDPQSDRSSADAPADSTATDSTTVAGSDPTTASPTDTGSEGTPDVDGREDARTAVDYLTWAGVAVLAVTALVALFGFYTGVSRTISVWVSSSYRPLVNAAFNLALLLAALGGIGLLLRRAD